MSLASISQAIRVKTGKSKNIDYQANSLLSIIRTSQLYNEKNPDPYAVRLILEITKSIFSLSKTLSESPFLHPEIIASGLAWRSLQHLYFDMCSDRYRKSDLLRFILIESSHSPMVFRATCRLFSSKSQYFTIGKCSDKTD